MRRTLLGLALAVAATAFAPAAHANPYCTVADDVRGVGPVCTVTCALTSQPHVDPSRDPAVSLGLQPCMFED